MKPSAATTRRLRERMVETLRSRGISDPKVLRAMGEVPREAFVDEALSGKAYDDSALPIGSGQTISQPWIVARMSELMQPGGGGRALEIGSGSGYQAAVLARLFDQVYSIERLPEFSRRALKTIRALGIENVHFKIFDGTYGWSEFAPFTAIVVTAGAPSIPEPLVEQLAPGGRLVVPISENPADPDEQILVRIRRDGARIVEERFERCRFVPLLGRYGWPAS